MGAPRGFRYAVEIRSPALFNPVYFRVLRGHGVAHVFNSWTDIPPLIWQMAFTEAFSSDFTASRVLMRRGRSYQTGMTTFAPYRKLREPNAEVRNSLRELLVRGKRRASMLCGLPVN